MVADLVLFNDSWHCQLPGLGTADPASMRPMGSMAPMGPMGPSMAPRMKASRPSKPKPGNQWEINWEIRADWENRQKSVPWAFTWMCQYFCWCPDEVFWWSLHFWSVDEFLDFCHTGIDVPSLRRRGVATVQLCSDLTRHHLRVQKQLCSSSRDHWRLINRSCFTHFSMTFLSIGLKLAWYSACMLIKEMSAAWPCNVRNFKHRQETPAVDALWCPGVLWKLLDAVCLGTFLGVSFTFNCISVNSCKNSLDSESLVHCGDIVIGVWFLQTVALQSCLLKAFSTFENILFRSLLEPQQNQVRAPEDIRRPGSGLRICSETLTEADKNRGFTLPSCWNVIFEIIACANLALDSLFCFMFGTVENWFQNLPVLGNLEKEKLRKTRQTPGATDFLMQWDLYIFTKHWLLVKCDTTPEVQFIRNVRLRFGRASRECVFLSRSPCKGGTKQAVQKYIQIQTCEHKMVTTQIWPFWPCDSPSKFSPKHMQPQQSQYVLVCGTYIMKSYAQWCF